MEEKRCPVCGEPLIGRFCGECGYDTTKPLPVTEPVIPVTPEGSAKKSGRSRLLLLIGIPLLALALAAAAVQLIRNRVKYYEVRFDPAGGTVVSGETVQSVEKGLAAAAPEVTRDGWFFDGWDTAFDAVTADTAVTALWTKGVSVTFDPAQGSIDSGSASQFLRSGSTPAAPSVSRKGYDFAGWSPAVGRAETDTVHTALWQKKEYTPSQLYDMALPSVVEIHVYDPDGYYFAQGSGFFIDTWGTIVTNYHVMEDAYSAEVLTSDGASYPVKKVMAWDAALDLAIIQCENTDSMPLTLSERTDITTGEAVYAIGSSLGLTGTISDGIVSTALRTVDGVECIQTTAPISHGNSGGPLLDRFGEVIGINSMTMTEGQNLNFAIRVALLEQLDRSAPVSMEAFYEQTYTGSDYMEDDGAEVFELSDYCEIEYNNSFDTADSLLCGAWLGGYVDPSDWDFFCFYMPANSSILVELMPYYTEDNEYLRALIVNEETDIVADLVPAVTDDGVLYQSFEGELEPGTYYIYVDIDDTSEYPYTVGAFYQLYFDLASGVPGQDYPDDEGSWVFTDADYCEIEINNTREEADELTDDLWVGGYLGVDDRDIFRIAVFADSDVTVDILPYYTEDAALLQALITDGDGNVLGALEPAELEGTVYCTYSGHLAPGGYYVELTIADPENYPYDVGVFYEASASVTEG